MITEVWSPLIIIVCTILGALYRAWATTSQKFYSRRTVFDLIAAFAFGSLLVPTKLDGVILKLLGLSDWIGGSIANLPLHAQGAVMLLGGYLLSSLLPKIVGLVNGRLKLISPSLEIELPDTGVLLVEKPPLEAKTPEAVIKQEVAIREKVEEVLEKNTATALAKVAPQAPQPPGP